jgi:transposase
MEKPLSKPRIAPDPESTLVCVIEISGTSWLVAAMMPEVAGGSCKSCQSPHRARWSRSSAGARRRLGQAGHSPVSRRRMSDRFWLVRLLQGYGIEVYIIHASNPAASRDVNSARLR